MSVDGGDGRELTHIIDQENEFIEINQQRRTDYLCNGIDLEDRLGLVDS